MSLENFYFSFLEARSSEDYKRESLKQNRPCFFFHSPLVSYVDYNVWLSVLYIYHSISTSLLTRFSYIYKTDVFSCEYISVNEQSELVLHPGKKKGINQMPF